MTTPPAADPAVYPATPPTPERVRAYRFKGLEATPVLLEHLLAGATDAEIDRRPDPERFTLREAVAHMADWEGVWLERIRRAATEDEPFLPGYDEGQWAIDHDYARADLAATLARFRAGRAELTAFLATLPPEAYGRVAHHGELGPVTLDALATLVLAHDAYHLRQAAEFRAAG